MTTSITDLTLIQREFRAAMARLSAGVNILTTDGPRGRAGMTVSAVCSVTDSPPTVLACVNRSSQNHDVFCANGRVCVNVLGPRHEDVALVFAGSTGVFGAERFCGDEWDHTVSDVPVLRGSVAFFLGHIATVVARGSHSVLFLEIDRTVVGAEDEGLVYFRRGFHSVGASNPA